MVVPKKMDVSPVLANAKNIANRADAIAHAMRTKANKACDAAHAAEVTATKFRTISSSAPRQAQGVLASVSMAANVIAYNKRIEANEALATAHAAEARAAVIARILNLATTITSEREIDEATLVAEIRAILYADAIALARAH